MAADRGPDPERGVSAADSSPGAAGPGILVLGTGALASLFGARLAGQASVTLLGTWPAQIEAVRRAGLAVETPQGEEHGCPAITADPREVPPADFALVLVKSTQTARAVAALPARLRPDGLAITLQNGLGNFEQLAAAVGPERAVLGVTTQGATMLAPGRVREGGHGLTTLGVRPETRARLEVLAGLLARAGFETRLAADLDALVWGKLVVNCAINPVTALVRVPNGGLLERPEALTLAEEAAREVAAVARARGVVLPFSDAAARVREVAQATAANRSSMLQDVLRGAPTEIEAITGAVVEEAQRLGVAVPVNSVLLRLIRSLSADYTDFRRLLD